MLTSLLFALSLVACNGAIDLPVNINLDHATSRHIAPNWVGYSLEIYSAQYWFGNDTKRTKPSFVNMMKQLMHTPDQKGPVFRIGGNSADLSMWNPDNQPMPANVTYAIKPADLIIADRAVRDINADAIYDVTLRNGTDATDAINHLKAIDSIIGWDAIESVEIGNEPDLFHQNGIRPSDYTYDQFNKEFNYYVDAVKSALPNMPVKYQGATFVMHTWYSDLINFAKEHQSIMKSISLHDYPQTHCNGHIVTIADLLTDESAQSEAQRVAQNRFVQALDAFNLPLYLGEGNSVSCEGMPGVSNAFASTLWALDYMFNLVSIGVQRMNFHAQPWNGSYSALFWPSEIEDQPIVQPLYYAHHLFALATRMDAQLVETKLDQSKAQFLKVWSARNREELNVVFLHKNDTMDAVTTYVNVTAPSNNFKFPDGEFSTLVAPSLAEQLNVTFAGRTWMNTKQGEQSGERKVMSVTPKVDPSGAFATYTVTITPASAALLNIKTRSQAEHRHKKFINKLTQH